MSVADLHNFLAVAVKAAVKPLCVGVTTAKELAVVGIRALCGCVPLPNKFRRVVTVGLQLSKFHRGGGRTDALVLSIGWVFPLRFLEGSAQGCRHWHFFGLLLVRRRLP